MAVALTSAAPSICSPTRPREVGEVLREADRALGEFDRPAAIRLRAAPLGRAGGLEREEDADGQPDQQEDEVGVELADAARAQPVAGGLLVAGVRARPGHNGAERRAPARQPRRSPAQATRRPAGRSARRAGPFRRCGAGRRPTARPSQATQQVQATIQGFRSVRTVSRRSRPGAGCRGRAPSRARAASGGRPIAHHGDPGDDRDGCEDEGEHPVAELDGSRGPRGRRGRRTTVGALRPGRAAETRGGQPDRAAAHDDDVFATRVATRVATASRDGDRQRVDQSHGRRTRRPDGDAMPTATRRPAPRRGR